MGMVVKFEYHIGQAVVIKNSGCKGIIAQMCISDQGKQYQVVYWYESIRRDNWLWSFEIEAE